MLYVRRQAGKAGQKTVCNGRNEGEVPGPRPVFPPHQHQAHHGRQHRARALLRRSGGRRSTGGARAAHRAGLPPRAEAADELGGAVERRQRSYTEGKLSGETRWIRLHLVQRPCQHRRRRRAFPLHPLGTSRGIFSRGHCCRSGEHGDGGGCRDDGPAVVQGDHADSHQVGADAEGSGHRRSGCRAGALEKANGKVRLAHVLRQEPAMQSHHQCSGGCKVKSPPGIQLAIYHFA